MFCCGKATNCAKCCYSCGKALLIVLLFPFILIAALLAVIVFIFLLPCYVCGRCCCNPACCLINCVDKHLVEKVMKLPCRACLWICEDIGEGAAAVDNLV